MNNKENLPALEKIHSLSGKKRPVVLMVLDGVGLGKPYEGNAVWLAKMKHFEEYMIQAKEKNLYTQLKAHGTAVGLPTDGDMGNSEVGHNALGAGQIYSQGAKLVNEALDNGSFFKTSSWKALTDKAITEGKALHLIGLLSDGNVHSNIRQLFKIIDGAQASGIKKIRIHALLDGRDVAPDSGLIYIEKLEKYLAELNDQGIDARIASGGGRMYVTMDRYNSDWKIVERGWNAHVHGKIESSEITDQYPGYFLTATKAITTARTLWPSKQDQFNPPFVIVDEQQNPVGKMQSGDIVINFNFRGDRAIELSQAFDTPRDKKFAFDRGDYPEVNYAGILEYDGDNHLPKNFLVPPPYIKNVSGEYLAEMGVKSYAIAETHKYGHVTYFWNGNKSGYFNPEVEKYVEIPSDPSEEIEHKPKMKAREVTEVLKEAIISGQYDFLRVNYANGDMVGHTGNIQACVESLQEVDQCLFEVVELVKELKGITIITADHGNSEEKIDSKGKTITSHTLNPVPFFIVDEQNNSQYQINQDMQQKGLANVTATFLNLLGYKAPDFYESSLISLND